MIEKIHKLPGIFFIFFVWIIFSSSYFIRGLVPYPSNYQVNHFHPWSAYEKFWGPVKNGAMPDVIDQLYPWRHFTIEEWKKGQIPLWNPNSFAGNPHLANFQSSIFSPFNILFFFLPFIDAWSLLILLQPLLAGTFMFLLLKEYSVSKTGGLIGAISFMFCGFIVVWMAYGTLAYAVLFLPLSLFGIEKYFKNGSLWGTLITVVSIPLSIFSGHFQTTTYVLSFIAVYTFFKYIQTKNIRKFLLTVFYFIIGISIACFQIIPSIILYLNSVRSEIFISGGGIPFYYLLTLFSPDFFGNPVTRNDWLGYYAEWASFVGVIPLSLAFIAVFQKKRKIIWFYAISLLIILLLFVNSPIQSWIGLLKIPVLSTSNPSRIIVLFSFCIAVLGAFGFDEFIFLLKEKKVKKLILPLSIITILFIGVWSFIIAGKIFPADKLVIARRNLLLPSLYLLILYLLISVNFFRKNRFLLGLTYIFLVGMTSFDSLRFALKWMPYDPRSRVFPDVPVIEEMKKNIAYGRVFGNIGAHVDTYYNLPSIEGYDPLYIERFGELLNSATDGTFQKAERSVAKISRTSKYTDRILDLLGVTLIFHPQGDTNQSWAFPVWQNKEKYTLIYSDSKYQLYRNNTALERVSLFYNYEVISSKKKILERLYSPSFNFRETLILEEKLPFVVSKNSNEKGIANIIEYKPEQIKIYVKTDRSAILFLSDNYYPTWKANLIDESKKVKEAVKIYRADYSFRAIVIPKGEWTVNFTYSLF